MAAIRYDNQAEIVLARRPVGSGARNSVHGANLGARGRDKNDIMSLIATADRL